jgi:hypothetical protein
VWFSSSLSGFVLAAVIVVLGVVVVVLGVLVVECLCTCVCVCVIIRVSYYYGRCIEEKCEDGQHGTVSLYYYNHIASTSARL